MKIKQNKFWAGINSNQLSAENIENQFENFKSSSINHKIALFNPEVNGIRYLKTLIYFMCSTLEEEWGVLAKIKNRQLGNPISISYNNESVCLDYIQAAQEFVFINASLSLADMKILEIGAGYGRTAHTLISNSDIAQYTIVDLENALQLSQKYLSLVLDEEQFARLEFISVEEIQSLADRSFDLAINIDSFAEMDAPVVAEYLAYIDQNCSHCYVKNPVGKYLDKSLDGHTQGQEIINQALKQGVLTDIINIDDQQEIESQSKKFIVAYTPSESWDAVANAWAPPFSYIWQALYKKS